MKNPKDYLENCEYISQDGDTVYIDEEALETCMEDYANQRVIEELEELRTKFPSINKKYTNSIIDKCINQFE
jgi:hypothetical protein|tara:strand:+ start:1062 stop:1277 length:216 start_codon:yes stop_codon:yes gene_type:complete